LTSTHLAIHAISMSTTTTRATPMHAHTVRKLVAWSCPVSPSRHRRPTDPSLLRWVLLTNTLRAGVTPPSPTCKLVETDTTSYLDQPTTTTASQLLTLPSLYDQDFDDDDYDTTVTDHSGGEAAWFDACFESLLEDDEHVIQPELDESYFSSPTLPDMCESTSDDDEEEEDEVKTPPGSPPSSRGAKPANFVKRLEEERRNDDGLIAAGI